MQEAASNQILYYVHDPMCSWCWGFKRTLEQLQQQLPERVTLQRILGGLAADNPEPMDEEMQGFLQQGWRRIEQHIPGVKFNFAFWTECIPRRSTYPACRAVIAAREQGEQFDLLMTEAIQRAYYTQARNPSDETTLVELAGEIGLDVNAFAASLHAVRTEQQLTAEIDLARQLHAESFPSLVLQVGRNYWPIAIDYNDSEVMLQAITQLIA